MQNSRRTYHRWTPRCAQIRCGATSWLHGDAGERSQRRRHVLIGVIHDAKEKVVASLQQEKDIMAVERVSRGQVKRVLGIEIIMMTKWCRLFQHPIIRLIEKEVASGEPILADPTDRYCGATGADQRIT
eukprot:8448666-Pyramimonas_sp.AAC.1